MKAAWIKPVFYIWLVPAAWALCALVSFQYPGDEYGLWAANALAGLWSLFLVGNSGSPSGLVLPIVLGGSLVMAIAGFILDRLRVRCWLFAGLWAISAAALCVTTILSYPSYQKAISKNGSLAAYVLNSLNMGLYMAVLVSIALALIILAAHRLGFIQTKKSIVG